jgi:Lon protease-like protein
MDLICDRRELRKTPSPARWPCCSAHTLSTQASNDQQMPVQKPYQWQDAGWVANRWCELLPVDNELKQRLMSLDNPLVRLELVSDLLEKLRLDTAR